MINFRIGFFLLVASVLSSCDSSPDEPIAKNGYPGKIAVIMENNCLGGSCHSSSTKENGGLDLTSWDAMMRGDSVTNDVLPFNALFRQPLGSGEDNIILIGKNQQEGPPAADQLKEQAE